MVGAVGLDAEARVRKVLGGRRIDATLLAVVDAPTYRWHARNAHGGNIEIGSEDGIYDAWQPELPAGFTGCAFIGSMRPRLQVDIAARLEAELIAADAMQSYASSGLLDVEELVQLCDWFFCNRGELNLLAHGVEPETFREQRSLQGLCLKAGAEGTTIYTDQAVLHVPALTSHPVLDTTGAGDALAGAFLARWVLSGRRHDALEDALAHGIACASIAIEDIGLRSLARATPTELAERVAEVTR
jgi:hypothetical protein